MLELKINSPAEVSEGESYLVRLTITNQSKKRGIPVEAVFGIGISAATEWVTLIPAQVTKEYFAPGETRTLDYTMIVPTGSANQEGTITAWVKDQADKTIASGIETVVILPPRLVLTFTNPKRADTVAWDARLYDEKAQIWHIESIRSLDEPCFFYPTGKNIVLLIAEWWSGNLYGPYLIAVPELGSYTWDGQKETLNGVPSINLLETNNRCKVTAITEDATNEWVKMTVESAEDISGYANAGKYFIGSEIVAYGNVPVDSEGSVVLKKGRRITVELWIEPYPLDPLLKPITHRWYADKYFYAREYPSSHYQFWGGLLAGVCLLRWSYEPDVCYQGMINYNVGGIAANFSVYIFYYDLGYVNTYDRRTHGPTSGSVGPINGGARIYAHPDPDAYFREDTWKLENWQSLGSFQVKSIP